MRLRKEARTKAVGTLSHGKMPTLLPIPCSLPKTQKSDERGRTDYTREVCGHREPEHVNRRERRDTKCPTGQGKGKSSSTTSPLPGWVTGWSWPSCWGSWAYPLASAPSSACKSRTVIRTVAVMPLWQRPDCWSPGASRSPPAGGVSPHEYCKRNSLFLCAEFGEAEDWAQEWLRSPQWALPNSVPYYTPSLHSKVHLNLPGQM